LFVGMSFNAQRPSQFEPVAAGLAGLSYGLSGIFLLVGVCFNAPRSSRPETLTAGLAGLSYEPSPLKACRSFLPRS
jgi:hypothetical protein